MNLICEMCNNDLIESNYYYVCNNCGLISDNNNLLYRNDNIDFNYNKNLINIYKRVQYLKLIINNINLKFVNKTNVNKIKNIYEIIKKEIKKNNYNCIKNLLKKHKLNKLAQHFCLGYLR